MKLQLQSAILRDMAIYRAELKGRDYIQLDFSKNPAKIEALGCLELLTLLRETVKSQGADVQNWALPVGSTHCQLLLQEVLLKSRQQWIYPYQHMELCHCRAVETETVDQAIIAGAHTCEIVSRQTSASTACGTCRADLQSIIDFRLKGLRDPKKSAL